MSARPGIDVAQESDGRDGSEWCVYVPFEFNDESCLLRIVALNAEHARELADSLEDCEIGVL